MTIEEKLAAIRDRANQAAMVDLEDQDAWVVQLIADAGSLVEAVEAAKKWADGHAAQSCGESVRKAMFKALKGGDDEHP